MPATPLLYEGRITDLTLISLPTQCAKFKLSGHDVQFVAGVDYIGILHIGDRVYAVCELDGEGNANVVEMIRRELNGAIPEADKTALLNRLGASLAPPEEASTDTDAG